MKTFLPNIASGRSQAGIAHALIPVLLVIAIVGTLGVVFYQRFSDALLPASPNTPDQAAAGLEKAGRAWDAKDQSISDTPAAIVAKADPKKPLSITITFNDNGKPGFKEVPATSKAHAEQIVKGAQADPKTIAVEATVYGSIEGGDAYRSSQWAYSYLRMLDIRNNYGRGSGVKVAVVDTGVQSNHPDLNQLTPTINTSGESTVADCSGHGTHVAGIIAATQWNDIGVFGIADLATIIPVKVFKSCSTMSGSGTTIGAGMTKAIDAGAKVLNLSLVTAGKSSAIETAVNYGVSKGVLTVAAAGNKTSSGCPVGSDGLVYPASSPGVVGVAAIESNGSAATYSCRGGWVDVAAPGSSIYSTIKGSTYGYKSGTSMATPHASGTAVLLYSRILSKGYSLTEQRNKVTYQLLNKAKDVGVAGRDHTYGEGIINPMLSLRYIQ